MKLLVTGAGGLLGGSFVAAAAEAGHVVCAIVRRPTVAVAEIADEVIVCDMLRLTAADLPNGLDAVVHFATGTEGGVDRIVRIAEEGTRRIYAAAAECGVARFVHVSSLSVYATRGGRVEPRPKLRGGYAQSKVAAERVFEDLRARLEAPPALAVVRPGLVFTPGMVDVLAGTAVQLPLGLGLIIGRPGQRVPFLDGRDLNHALLALLERQPRERVETYDILAAELPTKRELLDTYAELTGKVRRPIWLPRFAVVAAAAAVGLLRRRRGLVYSVRRAWEFDPEALPTPRLETAPASSRLAVRSALTVARGQDFSDWQLEAVRARASKLLTAPGEPDPQAPSVPLALLGAGRIAAEMHAPALRALHGFDVRAVVDPANDLAEALAASFPGATPAASLAELDWRSGAVAVVAPGFAHHEVALDALDRGASLLLEKPALLTVQEFDDVRARASEVALPVTVFHNYRLRPAARMLWQFLLEHDVGALMRACLTFHSPRLESERARWMREERRHRVLVMELGVHMLDLLCVVGGALRDDVDADVVLDQRTGATLSVTGRATLECGARL
ncbi:MAG TPA: NAD-dependent epimerase/dehydratase family protein, partial [Gaiellaceae bacterium]|nr:NAD-dependent epimerase/dehydratase family protein [Gaiellaceae bacterium]